MEVTENAIRLLQRSLNALGRQDGRPGVKVDGRPGRRTLAAFVRFLAARGREGEARLVRAMRALG
jgi:lysozyme family protein